MTSCALRRPAEGALRPDRASAAPDVHPPRIAIVGERVQLAPGRLSEPPDQERLGELGDLADDGDSPFMELPRRHRADTPDPLDGEWVEERQLPVRRHHEQAVGLGDGARHLGEELGARNPDRDRQADLLEHLAPQPHGDLGRGARDSLHSAYVEEGFVDRQSFDQRRGVFEDAEHRFARLGVGRHARRDDDRVRAQAARLPAAHRGADAVGLGLVARREHHASADDHGPTAEARLVSLLDRRIERVQVGVQDRRLAHANICSHELTRAARPASARGARLPAAATAGPRRRRGRPCAGRGSRARRRGGSPRRT